MEIQEAIEKRQEAEEEIRDVLVELKKKTGAEIEGIGINKLAAYYSLASSGSSEEVLGQVNIELKI